MVLVIVVGDEVISDLSGTDVIFDEVDKRVSNSKRKDVVVDVEESEAVAAEVATVVVIVLVDKVSGVEGGDVVVVDTLADPKGDKDK